MVSKIFNKIKRILYSTYMCIRYPFLYPRNRFTDKHRVNLLHLLPTYTEWDAMPIGWNKAFGKQYLKDLKEQLKKDKMLYKFRIIDLKEKYGILILSINYGSKELCNIIDKYEELSWNTCINCGKPATHTSKGWVSPYCEDCVNNSKNPSGYIKRESEEETEHKNV